MKKLILMIIFALLINNALGLDLTKWKYSSDITIENSGEKYVRLELTPEIYDAVKSDLSDIRIIESKQIQVPYILSQPLDTSKKHKYVPNVINRSTGADKSTLVTLDFGRQTIKNHIEVESMGNNFRRAVKIEGSNDNIIFSTLVERAFVFAIDNKGKSKFNNIELPTNDYRYLKVTVYPMDTEEQSPVVNEIRVFEWEKTQAKRLTIEMILINHSEDEKDSLSIYEYDLKFRNLPVNEIQFAFNDESFYRHITVEGRNESTRRIKINSEDNVERFREVQADWNNVTSDTIYRYHSAEMTNIEIPSDRPMYRYLKITVRNYDDQPLHLRAVSAKMIAHRLLMENRDMPDTKLYFGCESAGKAEYDISRRVDKPLQVKASTVKLNAVIENPLFGKVGPKTLPWTEKHKVLLTIILCAVVLALAGFIFKSFKSIQTQMPDTE